MIVSSHRMNSDGTYTGQLLPRSSKEISPSFECHDLCTKIKHPRRPSAETHLLLEL